MSSWSVRVLAVVVVAGCGGDVSEADSHSGGSTSESTGDPQTSLTTTNATLTETTPTSADESSEASADTSAVTTDEPTTTTITTADESSTTTETSDESESSGTTGVVTTCGNGSIDEGEQCDERGETATCDADCTLVECGDDSVNEAALEQCEDGNEVDGDGCDADCSASVVTAVSAGGVHTCVLLDTGAVRCWGEAGRGQIGSGATEDIGDDELPGVVAPLDLGADALHVDAGYDHTCARFGDGVRCWGDAQYGQLGYGNLETIGDDEPAGAGGVVDLGAAPSELATGFFHGCVLLPGGSMRCWGVNSEGQLGYGTVENIGDDELPSAVDVVAVGGNVDAIAPGFLHTCVLLVTNEVRCWGSGADGQLGNGDTDIIGDDEPPTGVVALDFGANPTQLVSGGHHSCVLLGGGDVQCWGRGAQGQLGNGTGTNVGDDELATSVGPVDVGGTVTQLAAGFLHTCALLDDGAVRCWGLGGFGQLGTADTEDIGDDELPSSIAAIDLGGTAVQISATNDHTCALLDTGGVRCWGLGDGGRLGYGDNEPIGDDEPPSSAGDVQVF